MPKLAIILTYYQRERQLLKTLDSFRQYDPSQFFVVIVDDDSPDDIKLPSLPFKTTILKVKEKHWINSGPTHNIGFIHALSQKPTKILIQNAECYHKGDILGYVKTHLTEGNYLSFACYSLGATEDINLKIFNNKAATGNGVSGWYNHSVYRGEAFHFCSAITTSNLKKINGFDERFAMGFGYEDNYFIYQVRCAGLRVEIVDNPFVLHQYHYDVPAFKADQDLFNRTGIVVKEYMKENKYRAIHLINPDL